MVPVEYPTRLLRLSLGCLSPLLDPKDTSAATPAVSGTSKRGKKRARGAEDGLVGGLEGRERASLSEAEMDIIVASLECESLFNRSRSRVCPVLLTNSDACITSDTATGACAADSVDSPPHVTLSWPRFHVKSDPPTISCCSYTGRLDDRAGEGGAHE